MNRIVLLSLLIYGFIIGCGENGKNSNAQSNQNTTFSKEISNIKYNNIGQVTSEKNIEYKYDKNGNLISLKRK